MGTQIGLTKGKTFNTLYAPLAVLGYCLRRIDYFALLREQVQLPIRTRQYTPYDKLLDCVMSLWAGCTSLHQINVRIRPDSVLTHAWGQTRIAEQSTLSETLDAFTPENLEQLRQVNASLLKQYGQSPHHNWQAGDLEVDIDLSHLPASRSAEGSTRGYGAGKKTRVDDSWCA